MDVLLVFPGLDFEVAYPLGLASVAAALRGAGHAVRGYDVALDRLRGLGELLGRRPPQVVGLAVWSPALEQARAVARMVRHQPGLRLVLGGPHASLAPARTLVELDADAVVVGEGEPTMVELLAAWQAGRPPTDIAGLCWRGPDGEVHDARPRPLTPVDALPVADRQVFDPRRYRHSWASGARHAAPVVTSRGCPLACTYCPSPALHHRRWRGRDPQAVLAEVRDLRALGVRHVLFEDEHPTVDRARWLALCRSLQRADLDLTWSCPNGLRPETLDGELLAAMAAAGCTRIALGVESTDAALVAGLGRADPAATRGAVAAAHAAGIEVTLYYQLGLPGADRREPWRQLREAIELGVSGAHFSLHSPLPGAALADAAPAPAWLRPVRTALYAGFYGHPRRLAAALAASGAGPADLPAAAARLAGWLRYGRRPG